MTQPALEAPRHSFARCIQHSVNIILQSNFCVNHLWPSYVPSCSLCEVELDNFPLKCLATKWPNLHWKHPGTALQDASNTQWIKIHKVTFVSTNTDKFTLPTVHGVMWSLTIFHGNVWQLNGPTFIGSTQAQLCKMHSTLSECKFAKSHLCQTTLTK